MLIGPSLSTELALGQTFTPIHGGALSLQLQSPVAGLGQRNGFLQAVAGLHPADQNQNALVSLMNLKSFESIAFLVWGA